MYLGYDSVTKEQQPHFSCLPGLWEELGRGGGSSSTWGSSIKLLKAVPDWTDSILMRLRFYAVIRLYGCRITVHKVHQCPDLTLHFLEMVHTSRFKDRTQHVLSRLELQDLYNRVVNDCPITVLEDLFAVGDWEHWIELNESCAIRLAGDDLLLTNV